MHTAFLTAQVVLSEQTVAEKRQANLKLSDRAHYQLEYIVDVFNKLEYTASFENEKYRGEL